MAISRITITDLNGSLTVEGVNDTIINIVHPDFTALFLALKELKDRADCKTLSFDLIGQLPSANSLASFNFIITATGRAWKQSLEYVVSDKNLSLDLAGTTGRWREAEVETVPALRRLLLDLYANHQIVKVAATWP